MRKPILSQTFLVLLLAGIVYACMEDELFFPKKDLPPEVSAAKKWYDSQAPEGYLTWQSAHSADEINTYKPDWRTAVSKEDKEFRTTEVYLVGEEVLLFVDPACGMKYDETGDRLYRDQSSDTRLVVRTNKETKETDEFIMIVSPDLAYVERHKEEALRNFSYLNRDPDFTGMIYYHHFTGEFSNAWVFKGAGEIYPIYPKTESDNELRAYYLCDEYCYWTERCTPYFVGSDYMYDICVQEQDYCWYQNCRYYEEPGDNGGGSGGGGYVPPGGGGGSTVGGNGDTDGEPYTPKSTDKMSKWNTLITMFLMAT